MSSKKIYLIRHGQTDFNRDGIVQGSRINASLNELGKKQGLAFFEAYKHVPFDKIYCSSLQRTAETVSEFIKLGIPYETHSELNEISWGIHDGTRIIDRPDSHYWHVIARWQKGEIDLKTDEELGESPVDLATRQQIVLKKILSREDEKNILICMHGRAMRILLCQITGKPLDKMDEFKHGNVCVYIIEYDGTSFTFEVSNDSKHLEHLMG